MKVTLKWLQEFVDISLPASELAEELTMAGSEVKGIEVIGGEWENIVIGQIVGIDPHPNADRLRLSTIDLGTERLTVVNGAPNLRLGDKVAFAHVGARIIDPSTGQAVRLKSAKIRGVVSNGMVCSEKELGISDDHTGIMILPADAPVSTPLAEYLGDTVFDLEVTPNRPDCLSIMGVAAELAALTGQKLRLSEISYPETSSPIDQQVSVEIADPDLCPRYCASLVTGVRIAESPKWMQRRLLACGMRPINNIVDITNYVMLECGQPLHAFDYEMLRGRKIIVRRARDGEVIVSLDGVERVLTGNMLVIADTERAVAVAGVMGGANSEVTEQTTTVLLEGANFNAASIHYTGRALWMPSEARMRFERGIRAELAMVGLRRATQLFAELAGGKAARGVIDVYPGKKEPKPILLPIREIKRVLGVEYDPDQVVRTLVSLGFGCRVESDSEVWAIPPYWRSDIRLTVDLIEEVARINGYDKILAKMLSDPIPRQNPLPLVGLKQRVGEIITGYGFQETLSYSLVGLEMLNKLFPESHSPEPAPIRVANPMTAEQEYLRPTLRAGLLAALSANRRNEEGGIRLFELGKAFLHRQKDLPEEREVLCGVMSGARFEEWRHGSSEPVDFYDAKGVAESLLQQLGVEASFEKSSDGSLHPNNQTSVLVSGKGVGVVGEIHPRVAQAFEITESVYLFEIDLTALLPFTVGHKAFQPVPRFPAVIRDMALVVDAAVTHQKAQDIINGFPLVAQTSIFDVYSGEQVPPGKKSLAYRIIYQSPDHTLTDEEVDKVQQKILERLSSELGATLRA